ncbi:MAG: hypothetical protein ACR2HH_01650 [Chthoniobacterales bacterium]
MKTAAPSIEEELFSLETGTLDPADFPHREHVRFAFEMLARHSFGEAVTRFSRGVRHLATKVEKPQLYHETITVGFLAIISERRALMNGGSWADFAAKNPDLLNKNALLRWYSAEELQSELARKVFCLPRSTAR